MIEAVPKHIFSRDFVLHSPDGSLVELDVSNWRDRAEFEFDGIAYRLYREGMVSGDFVLERAGVVIARAMKPSAFRKRFELEVNGHSVSMKKLSLWRRGFGVFDGEQLVGSIAPAGLFTRRTIVTMPDDWAVALQLFLFWLVLLMWHRQAAANSA